LCLHPSSVVTPEYMEHLTAKLCTGLSSFRICRHNRKILFSIIFSFLTVCSKNRCPSSSLLHLFSTFFFYPVFGRNDLFERLSAKSFHPSLPLFR
jgi:hypothetical protein